MEKKADKKKQTLLASVIVIALIAIIAVFFLKGEEGYRSIQVYQVNGTAKIERENIGDMDAYENLNLISGDYVNVMKESFLRLKLDEDKYLFAEEDSAMRIYALGDEKNSKTNVELEKGSITIEVEDKLKEGSSFEVTTPNSVMAVRGTVFRVAVGVDENGKSVSKVSIFEGSVSVQKIDADGNSLEEILVPDGKEAVIYEEDGEEIIAVLEEIDISELPVEVLEFLEEISEERRELSISIEEIKNVIEEKRKEESTEQNQQDDAEQNQQQDDTQQEETAVNQQQEDARQNQQENARQNQQGDVRQNQQEDARQNQQGDAQQNQQGNVQQGSQEEQQSPQEETKMYTVTYTYNGTVFGTQSVESGQTADEPTLMPSPSGTWDFDFSSPITKDTEIQFIDN